MSATTYAYTGTLTIVECAACHMDFGVTPTFRRDRMDDHANFYCPNGHHNYYPQTSDLELARAKATGLQAALDQRNAELAETRANEEHERRRAAALKGHQTRLRNRLARGKCPCCSEQFPDVEAHIAEEHPGYAPEVDA